jgi:hypothetical protein
VLARRGDEVISGYFEEAQQSQRAKRTADRDLGEELLIQGTRTSMIGEGSTRVSRRAKQAVISESRDSPEGFADATREAFW